MMYKIVNDLIQLSKNNYDTCLTFTLNELKKCDFISAVYTFGSINYPSVSDIDLLIIIDCDKDYKIKKKKIEAIIINAPWGRYCFWHEPLIVSVRYHKFLIFFHTIINRQLLYKKKTFKEKFIDVNESYNFLLQKQLDLYYFKMVLDIAKQNNISKRWLLLIINNLSFSLEKIGVIGHKSYQHKINCVRSAVVNDVQINVDDELKKLIKDGLILFKKSTFAKKSKPLLKIFKIDRYRVLIFGINNIKFLKFKRFEFYFFPKAYAFYTEHYKSAIKNELYFPLDVFYYFKSININNTLIKIV